MKYQIAKTSFLSALSATKKILDLLQYKFGKDSEEFKYLRKQIFDYVYDGLKKYFTQLEANNIVEKCSCGNTIRNGYASCPDCAGCGYKNKTILSE